MTLKLDPRALDAALDAYGIDAVVDGLEAAIAAYLAATQPQAGEPVAALEPFTTFAANNVEKTDDGWQWTGCSRDRICDWFGPSDFGLLQHFASALASPQPALAVKGSEPVAWEAIDEEGSDNFATSIYEEGYKGLLVARCNQNGNYPWQAAAILRGLEANRTALVASPPPSGEVEARKRLERAGGAMSNILYNLKQDPTLAEALRDRMSECQEEWDAALSVAPATAEGWRLELDAIIERIPDETLRFIAESKDIAACRARVKAALKVSSSPAAPTATGGQG